MHLKQILIPGISEKVILPTDIELKFPISAEMPGEQLHFFAYIPWHEKYLKLVPAEYQDFFIFALPYLGVRTTDVHTAMSMSYLKKMVSSFPSEKINERVVAIALILHDAGWSRLTDQEVAMSLGIKGLKLTGDSVGPKEKHALEGVEIAKKLLKEYSFSPPLEETEIQLVLNCILYHDKPRELKSSDSSTPLEIKILADLDHLWSFSHENFWQDTVRKGVTPHEYLSNLKKDLDEYVITEPGKAQARKLWQERSEEVQKLAKI